MTTIKVIELWEHKYYEDLDDPIEVHKVLLPPANDAEEILAIYNGEWKSEMRAIALETPNGWRLGDEELITDTGAKIQGRNLEFTGEHEITARYNDDGKYCEHHLKYKAWEG